MKITGSKRKGQHLGKNVSDETGESLGYGEDGSADDNFNRKKRRKRRILTVLIVVFVVLISSGVYLAFFVKSALDNPPPVRIEPWSDDFQSPLELSKPVPSSVQSPGVTSHEAATVFTRNVEDLVYTFLILALDDGNGNTDTIMTATFNTTNQTLEIVSIPRDTLANVGWSNNKKVNSIYANMRYQHGSKDSDLDVVMDATVEKFADILGYKVDYWCLVDLRAFISLIDAVGGVDFDIPLNMNYDDYDAGLHIHFAQGLTHLNGQQAMEVMRYRKGYATADIGRIGTQQDFLMTAAQQILEKRNSINIIELANIALRYVKTDIKLEDLIWFGRELMRLDSENINFSIMPGNYWDSVNGDSYVTIYVDEWLELVNDKLNPYNEPITTADVSILTRGSNGALVTTDGNQHSYASSGNGNGGNSNTYNAAVNAASGDESTGEELTGETGDEDALSQNGSGYTQPGDHSGDPTGIQSDMSSTIDADGNPTGGDSDVAEGESPEDNDAPAGDQIDAQDNQSDEIAPEEPAAPDETGENEQTSGLSESSEPSDAVETGEPDETPEPEASAETMEPAGSSESDGAEESVDAAEPSESIPPPAESGAAVDSASDTDE